MKRAILSVAVFLATFLIYHIGFGCNVFPVDEATNTLLAPDWYPMAGIAMSIGLTVLFNNAAKYTKGNHEQLPVYGNSSIIIVRPKAIAGALKTYKVFLDKKYVGKLHNDGYLRVPAEEGNHVLQFKCSILDKAIMDVYVYPTDDVHIYAELGGPFSHISPEQLNMHRNESVTMKQPILTKGKMPTAQPMISNDMIEEIVKEENDWRRAQSGLSPIRYELSQIDQMDGPTFEEWCANLLRQTGFVDVIVTPTSGDQGVDITAAKDGIKYAIQCKRYAVDLGNTPIQEVSAGKELYHCQIGVVMTNQHFTVGAKALAEATGTLLWDRDKLIEMLMTVK